MGVVRCGHSPLSQLICSHVAAAARLQNSNYIWCSGQGGGAGGGGGGASKGAAVLGVCWLRAAAGDILFTPSLLYEKLTGNWEPFTRHT